MKLPAATVLLLLLLLLLLLGPGVRGRGVLLPSLEMQPRAEIGDQQVLLPSKLSLETRPRAEVGDQQVPHRRRRRHSSHFPLCSYCCNCCRNRGCGLCCRT